MNSLSRCRLASGYELRYVTGTLYFDVADVLLRDAWNIWQTHSEWIHSRILRGQAEPLGEFVLTHKRRFGFKWQDQPLLLVNNHPMRSDWKRLVLDIPQFPFLSRDTAQYAKTVSATLAVLVRTLTHRVSAEVWTELTQGQQLLTIDDLGFNPSNQSNRSAISLTTIDKFCDPLAQHPEMFDDAAAAMNRLHQRMFGSDGNASVRLRGDYTLIVPLALGVGLSAVDVPDPLPYIEYESHNVDTGMQQLLLVAGLAVLWEAAAIHT